MRALTLKGSGPVRIGPRLRSGQPRPRRGSVQNVRYSHEDWTKWRGLHNPALNPAEAPAIRVFEEDGQLYSLDNRRLFVGQLQDAQVPVRYATPDEYNQAMGHLSSDNGGVGITVRGGFGYFEFPYVPLEGS